MFGKQKLLTKEEVCKDVLRTAESAKPKSYHLVSAKRNIQEDLKFFTFGCQGSAKKAQTDVALLMKEIAEHPEHKPDFVIVLGDNFYECGVGSPDADVFQTHFENIYIEFAKLNIPCFVILGNHDENYHVASMFALGQGPARANNQVAHSYLAEGEYSRSGKIELYANAKLTLERLPLWNMPARAYSLFQNNVQIFCIDSSSYVKDFLEYLEKKEETPPDNQCKWLEDAFREAKEAGRKTVLALHHPIFTTGARAYHSDINYYFDHKEKIKLKKYFNWLTEEDSYNYLLEACFNQQELKFDVVLAAHDHNLCFFNDGNLCQVITGGGGGKLQERMNFNRQPNVGCFLKHHGFTEVTFRDNHFRFIIRNLDRAYHLEFTNRSSEPIRMYPPNMRAAEKNKIETFCHVVYSALSKYFDFLNKNQNQSEGHFFSHVSSRGNLSHGREGKERAHNIWAYISNYHADDYEKTVETVYHMARWDKNLIKKFFTEPTQNSFITLLNEEINRAYAREDVSDLQSLYDHVQSVSQLADEMLKLG